MELISMTNFVLELQNSVSNDCPFELCINYANFLKQPLELWMFVPCDDGGNVFEEPVYSEPTCEDEIGKHDELIYQYQQAKERCLFVWQDGFDYNTICEMLLSIEDVINLQFELTQTAIKQLGL